MTAPAFRHPEGAEQCFQINQLPEEKWVLDNRGGRRKGKREAPEQLPKSNGMPPVAGAP